jgi:hypothetical protein
MREYRQTLVGYDNAQICQNGHVITQFGETRPQHLKNFCDKCGAATIRACPECAKDIQGHYHGGALHSGKPAPAFCHGCGAPYPWTQMRLDAAKQLADEDAGFSPEETEQFIKSLKSIVDQSPDAALATSRFKKLMTKAGGPVSKALRDILVDVLSEAVKKTIWPS